MATIFSSALVEVAAKEPTAVEIAEHLQMADEHIAIAKTVKTGPEFVAALAAQIGLELRYGLFRGAQVGINRTSERTIQFFGQYAFAESPSLPNYDPQTLARLNGKVIVSAEELRGMDTTIWKVRPRAAGDAEGLRLAALQREAR